VAGNKSWGAEENGKKEAETGGSG